MLTLNNWCQFFDILPFEVPESEKIFQWMLVACRVIKFRDVNFKILARILAIPKIIARVRKADNLAWCGAMGSLEHILLECRELQKIHKFLWKYLVLSNSLPQNHGFLARG